MGSEFLNRIKPTMNKYVDRKRVELATGDLFTSLPTNSSRTALFSITATDQVEVGDNLIIESVGRNLCVTKDGSVVGHFSGTSEQLISAIDLCGAAIGKVIQLNTISSTAEVTVS